MLRTASKSLAGLARRVAVADARRGMAMEGMKGYGDKEKAVEDMHFRVEEEKLLRKLLAKVRTQAHQADVHAAAGSVAAETSALEAILGKVSEAQKKALLDWKHTTY